MGSSESKSTQVSRTLLMLYCHKQLYIYIYICMQNHNDDPIKTSDTVF